MTIEEKYRRDILALQAISQYHAGLDEWSQAEGFCDVTQCAENTLKRLDEPIYMPNYLAKRGWSK